MMSRSLRGWLLGGIVIAFAYLLVHAREPLRLNLGDAWSDANVMTSIRHVQSDGLLASFAGVDAGPLAADAPLPTLLHSAVGKLLGVGDIATLRLVALMISALATWLLFSYVRRLYTDRVAWIATALFSTSLFWMMYADSLHQVPVTQCTAFLALWGVVRAIETRQRRHHAAAVVGSFACCFTSYDHCLFLPAAVLVTIYLKAGNPFRRGNRLLVALCALGGGLGLVATWSCAVGAAGWSTLVAASHDRGVVAVFPTMIRRITLVFTPFAWIAVAFHVVAAIRAPNLLAALKDTAAWLLLAALAVCFVFPTFAASQLLASQILLPFYAIGSALVLDRLLDGRPPVRWCAHVWLVAAMLWSFYFLFSHPRSLLDRGDVARTNAYLAASDRNDFVLSNLLSDGPIQAAFQRNNLAALDGDEPGDAPRAMMRIFERTGTDHVHAVIFSDPASRFIDRSLWPLALTRRLWSITGAPHMHRAKANGVITEYDRRISKNLRAVQATKVLQLRNYAVYRVDRAATLAILANAVPTVRRIDFGSVNSSRHEVLGWSEPSTAPDGTPASRVEAIRRCPGKRCQTVLTSRGLLVTRAAMTELGQVMIRVDPVCDLRLTLTLTRPGAARISINEFSSGPMTGSPLAVTVPARHLIRGVNLVEIENLVPRGAQLRVVSLDLEPACAALD